MARSEKQRGVLAGALPALALATLALGFGAVLLPAPAIADEPGARLAFGLRCDLFVLLWLVLGVGRVAWARLHSPADIDGSGLAPTSERLRVPIAVLQNTLEQVVLAVGGHLAFAVVAPLPRLMMIPVAVALFGLGRVWFWRGYAKGAPGRAMGFALTFCPTLVIYAYALVLVVRDWVA